MVTQVREMMLVCSWGVGLVPCDARVDVQAQAPIQPRCLLPNLVSKWNCHRGSVEGWGVEGVSNNKLVSWVGGGRGALTLQTSVLNPCVYEMGCLGKAGQGTHTLCMLGKGPCGMTQLQYCARCGEHTGVDVHVQERAFPRQGERRQHCGWSHGGSGHCCCCLDAPLATRCSACAQLISLR